MARRLILVVLANDASGKNGEYRSLGLNSLVRINSAIRWRSLLPQDIKVSWLFGAGADEEHYRGPTLAYLGERALWERLPGETVHTNMFDRAAYGTLEEIEWVVAKMCREYPNDACELVLFSQRTHLRRVGVIMQWFFPEVFYRLVETDQTKEIPRLHEVRGYVKLVFVKCGLGWVVRRVRRNVSLAFDRG